MTLDIPLDRHGRPLRGAAKQTALAFRARMASVLDRPPGPGVFYPWKGHYLDKRRRSKQIIRQRHGLTTRRRAVESLGLRRLLGPLTRGCSWRCYESQGSGG